jgi:DnaJ-class molecular chaperone
VLFNADGRGDTVAEVLGFLLLVIVGYVISLKFNPYVRCSRCKNKPKRKAWLFGYAHHVCAKCQGTGQQLRFGRRFLFKQPVTPGDR